MGCSLEIYRARVGTWAARRFRYVSAKPGVTGLTKCGLSGAVLCAAIVAIMLIIGGVEKNPGPEALNKSVVEILCSGCDKKLRSGVQCDKCNQWFHYSCGNVKSRSVENGQWVCEKCRKEKERCNEDRIRALENELRNARLQIEELKRKNSLLEEKLKVVPESKTQNNMTRNCASSLVLGDSIVRHVGTADSVEVKCFPGIRTEQLRKVVENWELGDPDVVIIHSGTNDLKSKNFDYVMGEMHGLVTAAKAKFRSPKIVISGVLRRRDMTWQRIRNINEKFDWVAMKLGVTFVDPNCWLKDSDFGRDGLHLNRRGAARLSDLYANVTSSCVRKPHV